VNQSWPLGASVIAWGWLLLVGVAICEIAPWGVIQPIAPGLPNSVNHMSPPGPAVMPVG
jgi:hypothetical protein